MPKNVKFTQINNEQNSRNINIAKITMFTVTYNNRKRHVTNNNLRTLKFDIVDRLFIVDSKINFMIFVNDLAVWKFQNTQSWL